MKIDFTNFEVVVNCEGDKDVMDISKIVGNALYANARTIEQDELAHAIHRGENPEIPDDMLPFLQQLTFNSWPVQKAWRAIVGEPAKNDKK